MENLKGNFQIQGNLLYKTGAERISNYFKFVSFYYAKLFQLGRLGLAVDVDKFS